MAHAESQPADDDAQTENDDGFTYYPEVKQHPTTLIEGQITELFTSARIDSDVESNDNSYGVVFENPSLPDPVSLWKNANIPDGFTSTSEYNDLLRIAAGDVESGDYLRGRQVEDADVTEARERIGDVLDVDDWDDLNADSETVSGVDYKVVDMADDDTEEDSVTVNGEEHVTGVTFDGNSYEASEVDGFESDSVLVWYGGMAGQFIGRALDFNGSPFARYTDDGYLVKGLYDVPLGWRGGDEEDYDVPTTSRSKLATDLGRPPRVARPPVLRDDIKDERAFIAIGRYNGGQMYEAHVGRAMDDYTDFLDTLRGDHSADDIEAEFDAYEMRYDQNPEETLAAEFDNPNEIYALYHGEGWAPKPDNAQPVMGGDGGSDSSGSSFDIDVNDGDDSGVEHPTEQEEDFAEMVATQLTGTGASPDDAVFTNGDGENVALDGLVDDNRGAFDVEPDVDAIRRRIYEQAEHLSTDDL